MRDRDLVIRDTLGPDSEELLCAVRAAQLHAARYRDRRVVGIALSECLGVPRTPRPQTAVSYRFRISHQILLGLWLSAVEPTPLALWHGIDSDGRPAFSSLLSRSSWYGRRTGRAP